MANRLPALQQGEQAERDRLEGVVQTHLTNATEQLVAARLALLSIRDQRLYKSTHRSFGAYCWDRFGISKQTAYRWIDQGQALLELGAGAEDETAGQQVTPRDFLSQRAAAERRRERKQVVDTTATEVRSTTKAAELAKELPNSKEGRGDEGEAPISQGAASEAGKDGEAAAVPEDQPVGATAPDEPTPEPKPDGEGDGVAVGALPQQPDTTPSPPGYGIAKVRPEDFVEVTAPNPLERVADAIGVPPEVANTAESHHWTAPADEQSAALRQQRILAAATTLWNAPRDELRAALTDSQRRHLAGRLIGTAPEPVSPKPKANGKAPKAETAVGLNRTICRHERAFHP